MKKILLVCSLTVALVVAGCNTTQQTLTYKSLYTVEQATRDSYAAYTALVIKGQVATNGVTKVSQAFNHFQDSFLVALDANQFNTNALAPSSLLVESQDVVNLINNWKVVKP